MERLGRNVTGWMKFVVLAMGITLIPQMSAAQYKEAPEEIFLEEIVVTESKMPQPEKNVTQKMDIVYSKEIDKIISYNRNIAELLNYKPGVSVNVLSKNDANWGSFGGQGPKYNTFLLDGIPIDSFADGMALDPWMFERIEIHRGPASILYSNYLTMDFAGNETPLAGITNYILKEKIETPMTRLLAGYGSYNTVNGKVFNQGKFENLHYFIGANYERSDYTNYGTENSWLHILDDPDYQKIKIYFKGTYFFNRDDHKISLFANHTDHSGDVGRPNRDYHHKYDTVNAAYSNQINDWLNVQLKAGYRNYDRKWSEDNFPTNLASRERDGVQQEIIPADLTFNLKHLKDSLFSLGMDYQNATYQTTSEVNGIESKGNDARAYNLGWFAQESYVLGDWTFRGGLRYNYTKHHYDLLSGTIPEVNEKSWDKLLWSGGIRYNVLPQLSFYTNIGNSFLVPSAKQVGGTLKSTDLGVPGKNGQLPNPNIKPENGISYDLGGNYQIFKGMTMGIRGFYTYINDVIVENRVSLDPSQSQSVNAGKSTSYGFEAEVKHAFNQYLQWFANFTYTHSKIKNSVDPDQDGADIPFVPSYVANVGVNFNLPYGFVISPYLHAVGTYFDSSSKGGRLEFGPYQIINARLQKVFDINKSNLKLNFDLNNITNKKFEMPWQFRDPGFSVFGSIEAAF